MAGYQQNEAMKVMFQKAGPAPATLKEKPGAEPNHAQGANTTGNGSSKIDHTPKRDLNDPTRYRSQRSRRSGPAWRGSRWQHMAHLAQRPPGSDGGAVAARRACRFQTVHRPNDSTPKPS